MGKEEKKMPSQTPKKRKCLKGIGSAPTVVIQSPSCHLNRKAQTTSAALTALRKVGGRQLLSIEVGLQPEKYLPILRVGGTGGCFLVYYVYEQK